MFILFYNVIVTKNSEEKEGEKQKPYVDVDFLSRCEKIAVHDIHDEEPEKYRKSLRAISCVLQSSPIVGNVIVASEKVLPRVVELAVLNPYPENVHFRYFLSTPQLSNN